MRTIASSSMTALLIVALFMGNCLSCPQVLLSMAGHHPSHSCCHHAKTEKVSCQSQGLQHFVKAESGTHAPPAVVAAVEPYRPDAIRTADFRPVEIAHIPPDLLSLNSTLRI